MVSTIGRPRRVHLHTKLPASDQQLFALAFHTGLDWMAVAWQQDALCGLVFGYASRRQAAVALARMPRFSDQFCRLMAEGQLAEQPQWLQDVVRRLRCFADGEPVEFADVPLALDHLTPFARRVVAACRRIGWGQVSTYGELAAQCGSSGAARAVGSVMAKNCYPLVVPCHRVLAAGGAIGGYSAPDGLRMKRRLLAMETGRELPRRQSMKRRDFT
jgi:methylated-DNA-[protein]-cysteine S-methyltransferase